MSDPLSESSTTLLDTCAKCGRENPTWRSFGVGCPTRRTYCLDHIPLRYRIKVAWQEWRTP